MKTKTLVVSWFSAGVSSAIATKLVVDRIDKIIYTHIDDQHPDTLRFVYDCEKWFGKKVEIIQSPYKSVIGAIRAGGYTYICGPAGAICTRYLKRRIRKEWELEQNKIKLTYIWGMDCTERNRAERLCQIMPEQKHIFPLIDKGITKKQAHRILRNYGIKRPAMYDLGYHNNNCIGCVKGGMGYWNKIRVDFPKVFVARAKMEREIGGSCINGTYLDELDPNRGRDDGPIVPECGIFCDIEDV